MAIEKALKIKAEKAAKKPTFKQRNHKKFLRVSSSWRKPRGLHNKLRRKRKGIGCWVMTGYKMPKEVRGMRKDGLMPIIVANLDEMKGLDHKKHAVIIKASTGKKNKILLLKEAISKKIIVANIKDPAAYIKKVEEKISDKRKTKKEKEKKKEEKKEEKKKKEDKKKEEEKTIEDITKEEEKRT